MTFADDGIISVGVNVEVVSSSRLEVSGGSFMVGASGGGTRAKVSKVIRCSGLTADWIQGGTSKKKTSYSRTAVSGTNIVYVERDYGFSCSNAANYYPTGLSWANAQGHCRSAGGRLCSTTELSSNPEQGTGCSHDSRFQWTATSCGTSSYYVYYGSRPTDGTSNPYPSPICLSSTATSYTDTVNSVTINTAAVCCFNEFTNDDYDASVTCTGAAVGDSVLVTPSSSAAWGTSGTSTAAGSYSSSPDIMWNGFVSGTNTVKIRRVRVNGMADYTSSGQTFDILVFQHTSE